MSKLYIIRNKQRGSYWLSSGNGLTDDRRKAYQYTWQQIVDFGRSDLFSKDNNLRLQEVLE